MKIAIVGQDQTRLTRIKEDLDPLKSTYHEIHIQLVNNAKLSSVINPYISTVILDSQHINQLVFSMVDQIRKLTYEGPIILIGHLASNFSLDKLTDRKGVYFLKKPFTIEQLHGIVRNCLHVEGMKQRRDERFPVRELASLECYGSDFKTQAVINDISKSGARIEGNLAELKKGEILRLTFKLHQINKERTVSARVVWVKNQGDNKQEAGLEFVSQHIVYKYLLDNAAS